MPENGARFMYTSESVNEGHPDKLCDQVSDAVLDAVLEQDPDAKVACETCSKTNMVRNEGMRRKGMRRMHRAAVAADRADRARGGGLLCVQRAWAWRRLAGWSEGGVAAGALVEAAGISKQRRAFVSGGDWACGGPPRAALWPIAGRGPISLQWSGVARGVARRAGRAAAAARSAPAG